MVVLALFFLSGACGLVYEVVWTRSLSLTFGITVFATSTVLAAFMGGLGLGSWLVSRRIDRSPDPLRVYALLEAGVGLYALAVPAIFAAIEPLYRVISNTFEDQFLLFNFLRALLAFLVLLVPATLMGGTVPAMGRYLVTRLDSVGWNVGILYALNTLGAVTGVVVAGFLLIGWLGMWRTTLVTAAVNLSIAVFLLLWRPGARPSRTEGKATEVAQPGMTRLAGLAVAVFAFSGLSAMAYEVVWTRVLVTHLHNTTYAFSTMLAVFLFGLALGDALLVRFYDRIARPLLWLGAVELAIALMVVLATASYASLGQLGSLSQGSWASAVGLMFTRAGVVLLPSALLFGATFPLVARIVCDELGAVGRDLGRTYAANTLGGIAGSLLAGFFLVPVFGLRGTLLALAALNAALGAACWLAATRGARRVALVASCVGVAVLPAILMPESIFLDALRFHGTKVIYYHEGLTDTTGVLEAEDGSRVVVYGDGRGTAGTRSNLANRRQGHLAHLLHPRPRRSLQIGFGVGNTLAAAALHPEVEQLDVAELSAHVRLTAPFFWTNESVLDEPKVRLIIDDGRNYLLRTPVRYDVITLEPPDIYTAGVVNLYTEEFYRLAYAALTEDGLICQWIPVGQMGSLEARMLVRAFVEVFPETTLWRQSLFPGTPILLVGSKKPQTIDVEVLAKRMQHPAIRSDLAAIYSPAPRQLFRYFIAGPEGIRRWVQDAPSVTDDRTMVDFSTPRSVYSGFGLSQLHLMGEERTRFGAHQQELERTWRELREPIETLLAAPPSG